MVVAAAPAEAGPRKADVDEEEEEEAVSASGRVHGGSGADPEGGRSEKPGRARSLLMQQPDRPALSQAAAGFEEVPMEADKDSDDDSDDSDADSDCGLAAMDDNSPGSRAGGVKHGNVLSKVTSEIVDRGS